MHKDEVVMPEAVLNSYRRFLDRQEDQRKVAEMPFHPTYAHTGCWMFQFNRVWYGIEPDGYLHS